MGCESTKEKTVPSLYIEYENENERQKSYALKLINSWFNKEAIKWSIFPFAPDKGKFCVFFRHNGTQYTIQDFFDDSDEVMNRTLQACYKILDKKY